MKRFCSALLCAVLLLGILPVVTPPARMIDTAWVNVNTSTAYVGDTLYWYVYGEDGSGWYSYSFDVYRNGVLYDYDGIRNDSFRFFTPTSPGTYKARVWVFDEIYDDHIVWFSPETVVTNRPAPLTNKITKVEAVNATALKVTWNKISGVSGYELWWNTSNTGTFKLAKSTSATTYTKTYLKAGVRYFFKVRTYTMVGGEKQYGSYSAAAAGVPMAKATITSAAATAKDRVKLTWSKVAGAGGYKVWVSSSPGGTYKELKATTATSITLTGLKAATVYYFKVTPYKKFSTYVYNGPMSGYKAVKTKAK